MRNIKRRLSRYCFTVYRSLRCTCDQRDNCCHYPRLDGRPVEHHRYCLVYKLIKRARLQARRWRLAASLAATSTTECGCHSDRSDRYLDCQEQSVAWRHLADRLIIHTNWIARCNQLNTTNPITPSPSAK